MDSMQSAFSHHSLILWLALLVLLVMAFIWLAMVQARTRRLEQHLEDLFHGASGDNVAQLLHEYLGTVQNTARTMVAVKREHDALAEIVPTAIRHVGLVRFSPFRDTGGDQSFTLAMLDGRGDGVVITALHSRTDSRLYAKPIQRRRSTYTLTPEEQEAMQRAWSGDAVETI